MTPEEQDEIYKLILDKHLGVHLDKKGELISTLTTDLLNQDLRGMVIIGAAYIEELCKECFLQTVQEQKRKKFLKEYSRELTFSLTSNLLWSQNYLSDEVIKMIDIIRDVRNKLAHNAFLESSHTDSITNNAQNIKAIMGESNFFFNPESFKNNYFLKNEMIKEFKPIVSQMDRINKTKDQYLIAITDIVVGLSLLSVWLVPEQKLARLSLDKDSNHIKVKVQTYNFTENTLEFIKDKYSG